MRGSSLPLHHSAFLLMSISQLPSLRHELVIKLQHKRLHLLMVCLRHIAHWTTLLTLSCGPASQVIHQCMQVFSMTVPALSTDVKACKHQYQAEACENDVKPRAQHVNAAIDASNALHMHGCCMHTYGICFTSRTAHLVAAPVNTDCRIEQ